MVFNSLNFALFLGVAYGLFLIIPARFKCHFLIVASYVFYGFTSPKACVILALVSALCFVGGHLIRKQEGQPRKQLFYLLSIIALLVALLVYFKYFAFVWEYFNRFATGLKSGNVNMVAFFVPVGISYYIFQGIGYLIDVYWGKAKAASFVNFLLFMSFFPKVMMGPIERGEKLLPQIEQLERFRFDYDRFRQGLLLFGWGLFKKLVVAERLALYVNEVYAHPADYPGVPVAAATVFFAFQLYSDFSGYTDMALGVGKLFGLELTQNFNRPFYATNIQDFWRRWHISLTSWITDYIFLPLRMSLRSLGKLGLVLCLFTAFILVGAWHGIGWTFIVFGALHGLYMVISTFTLRARDSFWKKRNQLDTFWLLAVQRLVTFGLVVSTLVFFRAASVTEAFAVFGNLFRRGSLHLGLKHGLDGPELMIAIIMIVFMEVTEKLIRAAPSPFSGLIVRPLWQRWAAYLALLLVILCFGVFANPQRFIYFAF